jgi:hypothetical protein
MQLIAMASCKLTHGFNVGRTQATQVDDLKSAVAKRDDKLRQLRNAFKALEVGANWCLLASLCAGQTWQRYSSLFSLRWSFAVNLSTMAAKLLSDRLGWPGRRANWLMRTSA